MVETALEDPSSKLAELLKHPDDLDKLASLKSEFTRKKTAIDAQLKLGLQEQLSITQAGMSSINDSQRIVQQIKEEMLRIDKLCSESQNMIRDFPEINRMSVMQRNFAAVDSMKTAVDTFEQRLEEVVGLLREDEDNLEEQPNLLAIHEGLTALRDVRDQAMEQVKGSVEGESGLEMIENLPLESGSTLREYFTKLDEVIDWFDERVGQACINLINFVQAGNHGLVVRLALVIEDEEKKDKQVKALQDAQREFGDIVSRFQGLTIGQREVRGYKDKFLQAIEASAGAQFEEVTQAFLNDPDRLDKACRWFFNDLNTVKLGLQDLVPKKWKIFKTYTNIYHKLMHDFLIQRLDDPGVTPVHMLAILNWVGKYYGKMSRLGVQESELNPHVIDDRESDLVREYRNLITKSVEEWMERMANADRKSFKDRAEGSLDQDADGRLHTKTLGDMWTMLREQLAVAESSGRPDVVEGVVDAMMRALKNRQQMWERMIDDEARRIENVADPAQLEGVSSLQEWLAAIANDQITNIDDNPESGTTSFLARFKADWEPLVTPAYTSTCQMELDSLTNGYVDLATHCMHIFAAVMFSTDFREAMKDFFTPSWYRNKTMTQITTTFDDYLSGENNYTEVLHPSLRDILVEELSDALLIRYLSAVRNKNVKFRRSDPFTDKIKEELQTVFSYFSRFPDTLELVKEKWRVVLSFESLLSADKGQGVVEAFENMKAQYWDVQIGWVEQVLRCRDDFDRSFAAQVKSSAARMGVERGPDTVMGKVK
ncbi:exocyst complex component Sec6-domain-containing protein [Neohortaea acidophila]|uniref:Exocyst complex component Sec6-domain-containing protein n=1 Tax=Neohortaea acidophila TaxID=245834 RepID=A0A6A6PGD1_9PEZI|nr:exocyst complex component Sec6-domain-containing protein [Neohortaea acidophila]KAF2478995.1 exocyst complex component Sec6-domain-containing protein [Neohortaea acidophila]